MKVLQVEDDPFTARSVEMMLQSEGYACDTTSYGEQAVELAQRNAYDVILLDVALPDIDGYEVSHRLRAAGVSAPLLFLSGLIDRDSRCQGAGLGVNLYLVKPIGKTELMAKIQSVVGSREIGPEPEVKSEEKAAERRSLSRKKLIKSGKIVYQHGTCAMGCTILSLSDGGAAIKPDDQQFSCPTTFTLEIRDSAAVDCEVCWRNGDKLGVRFVD